MSFVEALRNRLGAAVNGLGDPMVFYPPPTPDSNGAGKIVARDILRGKVTVKDFGSGEILELSGSEVGEPQHF